MWNLKKIELIQKQTELANYANHFGWKRILFVRIDLVYIFQLHQSPSFNI